jgi:hypothetical protein
MPVVTKAAKYVKAGEDRQRAKNRVQRKRWANKLDWPEIDAFIAKVNEVRDKKQ